MLDKLKIAVICAWLFSLGYFYRDLVNTKAQADWNGTAEIVNALKQQAKAQEKIAKEFEMWRKQPH